jgi:hypothetical protein
MRAVWTGLYYWIRGWVGGWLFGGRCDWDRDCDIGLVLRLGPAVEMGWIEAVERQ